MGLANRGRLLSTKLSEIGHARERRDLSSKGPSKSFIHHARRDLIRKSHVVHLAGDGTASKERNQGVLAQRRAQASKPALPIVAPSFPGVRQKAIMDVGEACMRLEDAASEVVSVASAAMAHPVAAIANAAHMEALEDAPPPPPPVVPSANSRRMAKASKTGDHLQRSGPGGSVYMTFLNEQRRSFKRTISDRTLTTHEMRLVESNAKKDWGAMSSAAQSVWERRFRQKKEGTREQGGVVEASPYQSNFGIGD